MAQKTVDVPGIGPVVLAKRRGTRNIRLSISAAGRVRVGLPQWLPYSAGISFAKSRADWIEKHRLDRQPSTLSHGLQVGKSNRLYYKFDQSKKTTRSRLGPGRIDITSPLPLNAPQVQLVAQKAAERALKIEAAKLLPPRLSALAARHGFSYKAVRIKKMSSRWGSCSSQKIITLNSHLMLLPWQLIDYVLVHELVHTRHLNHSSNFWKEFEQAYPGAKTARAQIRQQRPILTSALPSVA